MKAALYAAAKPLIICGAGTSVYSTDGKAPSWKTLIESGVRRVEELFPNEPGWAHYARERLATSDTAQWVQVADEVTRKIGGAQGAEMSRWLRECFAGLHCVNRDLFDAIVGLNCPIATTNYDLLITNATGIPPVNWMDAGNVLQVLKGDQPGIIHLHGLWTEPASVILGTSSYAELNADGPNRLLRTIQAVTTPTLLVGCGIDGVTDEDFTFLRSTLADWSSSIERKYWLVRSKSAPKQTNFVDNLYPVEYGKEFSDLPPFLNALSGNSAIPLATTIEGKFASIDTTEPEPLLFGRDREKSDILASIISNNHVVIAGPPGIGKTALAVSTLYHPDVVDIFSSRRIFVSLDNQVSPRAILFSVCEALGLPSSPDAASLVHQIQLFTSNQRAIVVLDNAEGVFEEDFQVAEKNLRLLMQVPNLTVVMTIRGAVTGYKDCYVIDDLSPLGLPASREAFLAISGDKFSSDNYLTSLLSALDGHALSLTLVAAQARNVTDLKTLSERWEHQKAQMLRFVGKTENRLTSVRASLAISLENRALTKSPLARRLLSILSELADGASELDCAVLLSGKSTVSKVRTMEAIAIIRDLRLVEYKPDRRIRMLNPLRESVRLDLPPTGKDMQKIVDRYAGLSRTALNLTSKDYATVDARISPNYNNVENACKLSFIKQPFSREKFLNLLGLLEYIIESGRPVLGWWDDALSTLANQFKYDELSIVVDKLAAVNHVRNNSEASIDMYVKYDNLIKMSGSPLTRGNSASGLATAYLDLSEDSSAEYNLKIAHQAYLDVGSVPGSGMANNLLGFATLAMRRGDSISSTDFISKADVIYETVDDNLGRANGLAELARLNWRDAEPLLIRAIQLIEGKGAAATISYLNTIYGDFLYRAGRLSEAEKLYTKATTLARKVGLTANEALASIRLGQSKIVRGAQDDGIDLINEGFRLWFASSSDRNTANPGFRHVWESLTAKSQLESASLMRKAVVFWTDLGRYDLINEWAGFKFNDFSNASLE